VKILNPIFLRHCFICLISRKHIGIAVLLTIFSLGFVSTAVAQLLRFPAPRNNPSPTSKSKAEVARKQDVTISLPFWDDFSFTVVNDSTNTDSNAPITSRWSKGRKVWINDGLGINAPTINVASFDGLDSLGLPYSDLILKNGFRDTLQSQFINLDEVSAPLRNSVFLSFSYQWQGNGEAPDPSDYMLLQLKDNTGKWVDSIKISTKSSFDKTVFYDTIVQINNPKYFHDAFQFRFQNYGRESGPFDTWNIDYVYLNKGRTINDNSFPDRALASTMTQLFGNYSAMPIKHFFAAPKVDSVMFDVKNLDNDSISNSYRADAKFINFKNSGSTTYKKRLIKDDVGKLGGLMLAFQRVQQKIGVLPDPADVLQFDPDADSIRVEFMLKLISGDSVDAERFNFSPIDLRINDTISNSYNLDDYYAYDDGVAEYSAALTREGNRLAYQFTRPSAIPDSIAFLQGFDIYFPDFGVVNGITADFIIYDDNGGLPGEILYTRPSYLIEKKGTNKFQYVEFGEPFLVGLTYYIGWKATASGTVIVGLDVSNNTGDKMIVYTNGVWNVNDAVEGSLMIRPRFGEADVVTGIGEEKSQNLQVFPNPSGGQFFVRGKYDRMEIVNVTGQSVSYTSQQDEENTRIAISNPKQGMYILKIITGSTLQIKKIIVDQ